MPTSLNLITLGCSKNLVDSEHFLGQLPERDFKIMHDSDEPADIVVINTCGFVKDAKEESIETILQFARARQEGLIKELVVMGCLSQRYMEELKAEVPEVDFWFGARGLEDILRHFINKPHNQIGKRFLTTPGHFAYLKISEGCDRTCSFCAIPLIRGEAISRTIESLVAEANQLATKGVKELILIAQDLTYYGYDFKRKSLLAPLLRQIIEIEGIEWIRLHYAYPKNFPEEVIELMAHNPKICRYVDIPLQHINDKILSDMRRGHDKAMTLGLLEKFKRQVPGIALRTTLMVGFPGETKEQFKELLDFVALVKFDRLGVFTYSPEEGTRAYELPDDVPSKEKQRRANQLMELQREISAELNHQKIGQTFKVMIDRREGEYFIGRTEFDSPEVDNEVLVSFHPEIVVGEFAKVTVTSATDFELFANFEGQK